jgi:hypothetical protein
MALRRSFFQREIYFFDPMGARIAGTFGQGDQTDITRRIGAGSTNDRPPRANIQQLVCNI